MFGSATAFRPGGDRAANHYNSFSVVITSEGRIEAAVALYSPLQANA